jgi:hypothetical protein
VIAGDTPIRDILLPDSDRTALIQVIVVVAIVAIAASVARRERALVRLVLGVGAVVLGLMSMRTLH